MQPRTECAGGELLMACAPTGAGLSKYDDAWTQEV